MKGWRAHVLSFLMGIVFAPMVLFAQLDGSRKVDLREDRVLMVLQCAWWATLVTLLAWGLWSVLT